MIISGLDAILGPSALYTNQATFCYIVLFL